MNAERLWKIALADSDTYAIRMHYTTHDGNVTERIVSPIRFVGDDSILALCLCREEPRRFTLSQCSNVKLMLAADVLMPVAIQVIHREPEPAAA